jgi:uncharacterized protein (TIGR02231 family)
MWKRVVPTLAIGGLVALLMARHLLANPPDDRDPPVKAEKVAGEAAPAAPGMKTVVSRVNAVTVYPNSALVTREVEVPAGTGTLELTVTPLPPTTVNSSLYTEGSEGIRVLTTRFRSRSIQEDTRADVRKLQEEIKEFLLSRERLTADIEALEDHLKTLEKMKGFLSVTTVQSAEKGMLNSEAAIALSKHIRESRLETARELIDLKQQVQANQEQTEFAQRRLSELSTGPVRVERDAIIVVEKSNAAAGTVRLNYLVDSASWRPQYKLRAGKTAKDQVQLEYLAAVVQHTGEDWSHVKLVLSTAQPALNSLPPDLQTLKVSVVPQNSSQAVARNLDTMELEDQVQSLRSKAQMDFNSRKQSSGVGLVNTAAALNQSWELFNPEAAVKRGCALAAREGPTVTYHLNTSLTVPSRSDEQILEVARLELAPDYYYKAVPLLTTHVYRLADLANRSNLVLLPGEATMYIGTDFVGQMNLPLVAIGEQFTVGFGIDPQLQVQRQMTDKGRTTQGANQSLRYEYRILVSSYKSEPVKLQVWDRLPHGDNNEAVGVTLIRTEPEISADALYVREQRPNNLLRWDVKVDPNMAGEKALAIKYEFKLELERQMTISSFQTAGVFGVPPDPANPSPSPAMPAMSSGDEAKVKAAMAKLSPEDRRLAEAQFFCAIDQESPLGTMGPILKVMVKGQPVFLCCKGCEAEARAHPDETLIKFQKLMARMSAKR